MDAVKFILKWSVLLILVLFALERYTSWNLKQDERAYTATQQAIAAHQVLSGMTPDQVEQAWGKPDRIDQGFFNGVEVTQWFYRLQYVAFRDGVAVIANATTATQANDPPKKYVAPDPPLPPILKYRYLDPYSGQSITRESPPDEYRWEKVRTEDDGATWFLKIVSKRE